VKRRPDEQTPVPPILRAEQKICEICVNLRIKPESTRHAVAGGDARAPDSLPPFSPETHDLCTPCHEPIALGWLMSKYDPFLAEGQVDHRE
jgi:hypothetical protein